MSSPINQRRNYVSGKVIQMIKEHVFIWTLNPNGGDKIALSEQEKRGAVGLIGWIKSFAKADHARLEEEGRVKGWNK